VRIIETSPPLLLARQKFVFLREGRRKLAPTCDKVEKEGVPPSVSPGPERLSPTKEEHDASLVRA
jgi:hypothetical protein